MPPPTPINRPCPLGLMNVIPLCWNGSTFNPRIIIKLICKAQHMSGLSILYKTNKYPQSLSTHVDREIILEPSAVKFTSNFSPYFLFYQSYIPPPTNQKLKLPLDIFIIKTFATPPFFLQNSGEDGENEKRHY